MAPSPQTLKRPRVSREGWKDDPISVRLLPVKEEPEDNSITIISLSVESTVAQIHHKAQKASIPPNAKNGRRIAKAKGGRSRKAGKLDIKSTGEQKVADRQLPSELLELLDMQRVILKTVVLQITHQRGNTPINISELIPHASRTWGKRKITVDDIRRCIAIQDMQPAGQKDTICSPFIITDYGRGKICLEIDPKYISVPLDEERLCKQFEANLHVICAERAMDEMSDLDISFDNLTFNDLPKSEITVRHSGLTHNPILAKGQRALTELKNGIVTKQQEKEAKVQAAKLPTHNPDGTKMSLLDRLRAKELANAAVEQPSGPELARKRALQRIVDISAIIAMLVSSSNQRNLPVLSYIMPLLQQKLKDSVRVPMSVEEGIEAVHLLAREVAPEWLKVVTIGGKEHVVIQTRCKPYDSELAARVSRMLG